MTEISTETLFSKSIGCRNWLDGLIDVCKMDEEAAEGALLGTLVPFCGA